LTIEHLSAVTLAVLDMGRSVRFYTALGFPIGYGGEDADFTSMPVGSGYLNLALRESLTGAGTWGRAIFYVSDVDAVYERALAAGLQPSTHPRDAEWGERYFHIFDPDGHEISFAKPLPHR
jgi:catechol 2,3-dioxygenase-like lactoylglutathione lyase family enzyme